MNSILNKRSFSIRKNLGFTKDGSKRVWKGKNDSIFTRTLPEITQKQDKTLDKDDDNL